MKISQDDKLAAFGLFMLSAEHYRKCREYEVALARRLGFTEDGGNFGMSFISDSLYDYDGGRPPSMARFEEAIAKDGVEVEGAADGK